MKKLLFLTSLFAFTAWASPSIREVQSVGSFTIGMSEAKVKSLFSYPPKISSDSSQQGPNEMLTTHDLVFAKDGVSMIMAASEKTRGNYLLHAIVVRAPFQGGTPQGIRIGSSWEEVNRTFPKPLARISTEGYITLGANDFEGAVFAFRAGRVSTITIGNVGDADATFPPIY